MKNKLYDHGYGIKWDGVYVEQRERYHSSVADFHEHDFYEINLILSGNVKILLTNQSEDGTSCKIVLTKPNTTHFISCNPDTLYSSLYLVFTDDFITSCNPEWMQLLATFGKTGKIITLSDEQKKYCKQIITKIKEEKNSFRKKILIMYLLSYTNEFSASDKSESNVTPNYIIKALHYINEHFPEKIVASDLARRLFVCRTTLMTDFKKYTGSTLNNYIIHCRLKKAIQLLRSGKTEHETAEKCGLGDVSGLIRCFKRSFGMTPKQYMNQENSKSLIEDNT
ncbi:MAG: helix-turn-helix domain-containing protein [Clostridia bacterium]|nr:helix-turn-helix domain-containing protein [Clostridia bacterium]